jgi:ABC-2 type transport system ATP-binding protein
VTAVARLDGITLRLGRRFDLSIPELTFGSGITAVVGTNGSGKTTLLRLVTTVLRPDTGTITVSGNDTSTVHGLVATRHVLGYLPQHDTVPNRMTVFDHVDLVAVMREVAHSTAARRRAVGRAIRAVGLADLATERCSRLSGGQRRRVAIAAAIAGDPQLLVLDEPDAHLDDGHRDELGGRLRERPMTVVLSTHDRQWASEVSDRIVELRDGRVVGITRR